LTASTGNAQPLPNPGPGDETPQGSDASDREATGPCSPANPSAGGATGTLGPELAPLLESLRTAADEDGLVCPRWRDLAGTLGVPIRTLRRRLVELVSRGALLAVGVDTYALPGTSAATLSAGEEPHPPAPRLPPHDAVHDLPGWMLPW
jgi:hypothetical protein